MGGWLRCGGLVRGFLMTFFVLSGVDASACTLLRRRAHPVSTERSLEDEGAVPPASANNPDNKQH